MLIISRIDIDRIRKIRLFSSITLIAKIISILVFLGVMFMNRMLILFIIEIKMVDVQRINVKFKIKEML